MASSPGTHLLGTRAACLCGCSPQPWEHARSWSTSWSEKHISAFVSPRSSICSRASCSVLEHGSGHPWCSLSAGTGRREWYTYLIAQGLSTVAPLKGTNDALVENLWSKDFKIALTAKRAWAGDLRREISGGLLCCSSAMSFTLSAGLVSTQCFLACFRTAWASPSTLCHEGCCCHRLSSSLCLLFPSKVLQNHSGASCPSCLSSWRQEQYHSVSIAVSREGSTALCGKAELRVAMKAAVVCRVPEAV